jgi:carbon-monoxide dehydrogenase small subunit
MTDLAITLTINGERHQLSVRGRTSLADLLRDELGLTGTHLGCEQGVCGACTVLVDDLPVRSCLMLAGSCDGSEVVTIEGLADEDATCLRSEFSREGGLQCGFCTPGMLIAGWELIRRRQNQSRDSVCEAMSGNICRCTGYNGIVRAVLNANQSGLQSGPQPDAAPQRDEAPQRTKP